jgi:ADP-heptose:LPS heptosyltransferase
MTEGQRILILRRKALGDVIVSMAVPAALRRAWPHARIELVVDRFAAPAVQGSPHLDAVLVYDRRAAASGPPWARTAAALRWLRRLRAGRYDMVLDLMGTPQTAAWTRATSAAVRVGRRRRLRTWAYTHVVSPTPGPPRFAGEVFLDWVRALGLDPGPWRPVALPRPAAADLAARAFAAGLPERAGPRVVLNPSATWAAKAWPLPSFAVLAQLLRGELDAQVVVAWGPGEESARDAIVQLADGAAQALPACDIPELAAHLALADLVVTTDSGPKHIAVAEEVPTLTLYGSTDPRGWQPPGEQHAWTTHDVACRPCNRTVCPVPGHPCLDALSPRDVLQACAALLARVAAGPGARASRDAGQAGAP